jgi:hypothetical protein
MERNVAQNFAESDGSRPEAFLQGKSARSGTNRWWHPLQNSRSVHAGMGLKLLRHQFRHTDPGHGLGAEAVTQRQHLHSRRQGLPEQLAVAGIG